MNLTIATINPFEPDEVREALTRIGVRGMMVSRSGTSARNGTCRDCRGADLRAGH